MSRAVLRLVKPAQGLEENPNLRAKAESAKTELEISIREYLVTARQAGRSQQTIKMYGWHLEKMAEWLIAKQVTGPDTIVRPLIREWGASLYEKWESATIKQAVCAARGFLKWCYEERKIEEDLRTSLQVPRVKKRIQRTLTAEEVQAMLDACDLSKSKGIRDVALISLLIDSGLRAAEICRLRIKDVEFGEERNVLKVVIKGGNEEYGYFGPVAAARLKKWLRVRHVPEKVKDRGTVFVSIGGIKRGHPLTISGTFRILTDLGKKAGVPAVSTHSFRRSFACLMTEAGAPTRLVQEWGRWESENMVKQYTLALQAGKLYNRYSPTDFLNKAQPDESKQKGH